MDQEPTSKNETEADTRGQHAQFGTDSHIPETSREWYEWLIREEGKTLAAYRTKPSLLVADCNRERAVAQDYRGREILELLQNANDQAAEQSTPGRVLIELSTDGLIVANTGLAFSVGGVASLQTSHLSPKRHREKQLIGKKGLGFRSVLNWSKTPVILSKALCLAYCADHALARLRALSEEAPEIAHLIQEEKERGNALTLPLLSFPLYAENDDLSPRLTDTQTRAVFERCKALKAEGGYDTIIGMPFDSSTAHDAVREQLEGICTEVLLFVKYLSELQFSLDGETKVTLHKESAGENTTILESNETIGQWRVHTKHGKIPDTHVEQGRDEASVYEIAVAVPATPANDLGFLFSHFPTDIRLPLPAVCHATLELEQNRKHLQQGRKCNEFVLSQLADFLPEIAELMAASATNDPWGPCALLMNTTEYSEDLKRERFHEKLIASAKTRGIVPTLSGRFAKSAEARLIAGANSTWLPARLFPEVVPLRSDTDTQFLTLLGVARFEFAEIKNRIVSNVSLTCVERVELIAGLLKQPNLAGTYTSALLLDSLGIGLADGSRAFLAPSKVKSPNLPPWVEFKFLNEEMELQLKQKLAVKDSRDLQQKLSGFGLLEYSLANVIQALVTEAGRSAITTPDAKGAIRTELLRSIFDLYKAGGADGKRPDFPEKNVAPLPTQNNTHAAASMLYLGNGFGSQGRITQALYEPWAPEKLIDIEKLAFLKSDETELGEFLIWMGVRRWPRESKRQNSDDEFVKYLLRIINFPANFGGKVIDSMNHLQRPTIPSINAVEDLDDILAKSAPGAIAAWLVNDERAVVWGRRTIDHAVLTASELGSRTQRPYFGPLPSFTRWKLQTTAWMQSSDGQTLRPDDCVLGERPVDNLFPQPVMPDHTSLDKYGVQKSDVVEGWRLAGVLTSLAYLERDAIYAKLLDLPQRNPDGKYARALYHVLLDASDTLLGGTTTNQKLFLSQGLMWGRQGNVQGYFPIASLRHVDFEGIPEALIGKLKIVDLRARVGTDKVLAFFGVKSIDRRAIKQKPIIHDLAHGSTDANSEFQIAKPYFYQLRASQSGQIAQLQALKELQLEVCSTLKVELIFEGDRIEYDVPVWGSMIDEKTLYVRCDPARGEIRLDSLLTDAIGEALASFFRVSSGADYARMLLCNETDRLKLLQRLRGDAAMSDIETLISEFAALAAMRTNDARFQYVAAHSAQPTVPIPEKVAIDPSLKVVEPVQGPPIAPNTTLLITPQTHVAQPAPERRSLQIQPICPSIRLTGSGRQVIDWDFCEKKAIEFEETSLRWPLRVGQITGMDGAGCDIYSFASQEACKAFEAGTSRDLKDVVRFIEVKGRSSHGATIDLQGNELSAAERYGAHYFLYRLFEAPEGRYELDILQNPLSHKEALQQVVSVVIQRAAAMQRFSLAGGFTKDSG